MTNEEIKKLKEIRYELEQGIGEELARNGANTPRYDILICLTTELPYWTHVFTTNMLALSTKHHRTEFLAKDTLINTCFIINESTEQVALTQTEIIIVFLNTISKLFFYCADSHPFDKVLLEKRIENDKRK